jgi:hypothetical protein
MVTRDQPATLFYTDTCPFCGDGLVALVEFFVENRIPLVIRKPKGQEISRIPAYPALFVPKSHVKPVMLVGTGIVDVLRKLPELAKYHGCSLDDSHQTDPGSAGKPGVQRADAGGWRHSAVQLAGGGGLRVSSSGDVAIGRRSP